MTPGLFLVKGVVLAVLGTWWLLTGHLGLAALHFSVVALEVIFFFVARRIARKRDRMRMEAAWRQASSASG